MIHACPCTAVQIALSAHIAWGWLRSTYSECSTRLEKLQDPELPCDLDSCTRLHRQAANTMHEVSATSRITPLAYLD